MISGSFRYILWNRQEKHKRKVKAKRGNWEKSEKIIQDIKKTKKDTF